MKKVGKFILLDLEEFKQWLVNFQPRRHIGHIQQHHTFIPSYKFFNQNNHFQLCDAMERDHMSRKPPFSQIGQNITTFPDGTIMICRDLNNQPACIALNNYGGICIENVGNFDVGKDTMTTSQKDTLVSITQLLLDKFSLVPSKDTLVYHHWFDLKTGERIEVEGKGEKKSCPGSNFFGGNSVAAYTQNFLTHFNS